MSIENASKAWAIWNSCQGIFTCSVFHTRKEAEVCLSENTFGDAKVVPVLVVEEPDANLADRHWEETEAEKYR